VPLWTRIDAARESSDKTEFAGTLHPEANGPPMGAAMIRTNWLYVALPPRAERRGLKWSARRLLQMDIAEVFWRARQAI
jgi:hypothetical protein